jgi:hypothetical protein
VKEREKREEEEGGGGCWGRCSGLSCIIRNRCEEPGSVRKVLCWLGEHAASNGRGTLGRDTS